MDARILRMVFSLSVIGLAGLLGGCDATIELTKAPFDATTDISNGVSAASSEFTQPTQELTSSTTPGAMANVTRARQRLEWFTSASYENLRADISRGNGEYLVSLATLAGVPNSGLPAFQTDMQRAYTSMFDDALTVKDSTAQIIEAAWSTGYGRQPSATTN